MSEPTSYPQWASSPASGDLLEPIPAKKASGWEKVAGTPEKPPYQYFNWWMNNVYNWIKFFRSEDGTFAGKKTFSGGIYGPGAVPIGGMVAVMPTLHANAWQPGATGVIKDGFMRADGHTVTAQNVTDGCLFPAATVLPNMVEKYPRGNITSGTPGGSNTQASNVTISAHSRSTDVALSAHSLSTNVALTANHTVTQPTFNVPGHYHSIDSTGATLNIDTSSGTHSHAITGGYLIDSSTNTVSIEDSGTADAKYGTPTIASSTGGHVHAKANFGGYIGLVTGGSNGDASFATTAGTSSAVAAHVITQPAISAHTITQPAFSDHTVTNNAVNNEPAYVEVVWVIRVA